MALTRNLTPQSTPLRSCCRSTQETVACRGSTTSSVNGGDYHAMLTGALPNEMLPLKRPLVASRFPSLATSAKASSYLPSAARRLVRLRRRSEAWVVHPSTRQNTSEGTHSPQRGLPFREPFGRLQYKQPHPIHQRKVAEAEPHAHRPLRSRFSPFSLHVAGPIGFATDHAKHSKWTNSKTHEKPRADD